MNRCLNDPFGYCSSSPDIIMLSSEFPVYNYEGRATLVPRDIPRCSKDPLTCGNYLTFTESLELAGILPSRPQPWQT